MAPTARPVTREDKAFNLVFSVFIQEMLHLQMAANICTAIGGTPSFTSPALQKPDHGWSCYGPEQTTIPHVINLLDTTRYHDTKVSLGALNKNTLDLFCAIEQTEKDAMEILQPDKRKDYFPTVPFKDWNPSKGETDLPMFGSIGHMYECYAQYCGSSTPMARRCGRSSSIRTASSRTCSTPWSRATRGAVPAHRDRPEPAGPGRSGEGLQQGHHVHVGHHRSGRG